MNRLHITFADNGGLVRVPLIVPEGQGGSPWVPETVQAAARVLLEARNRDGMTVMPKHMMFMLRALAQEDTE
jgi:hypothetical protein